MYSPEEYQLKKFIQKNKKLQRQIAEYNEKTLLKSEKEEIKLLLFTFPYTNGIPIVELLLFLFSNEDFVNERPAIFGVFHL